MTEHAGAYRLLDSMDGLEVPPGTNLLVTASAPAGREFLFRLLGQGLRDGESLLVITTEKAAGSITEQVRDAMGETTADPSERLRIIDCQTDELEVSDEALVTQNVDTPRNLTDIGIGFENAFDEFEAQGVDRVRFGLLSLSVVLSYVDRETGYRFCQTLTRGLGQEDALGLFLLNVEAHDERTVNTLRRAFDGTREVTSESGELNARVSGVDGISDDWIPVEE